MTKNADLNTIPETLEFDKFKIASICKNFQSVALIAVTLYATRNGFRRFYKAMTQASGDVQLRNEMDLRTEEVIKSVGEKIRYFDVDEFQKV